MTSPAPVRRPRTLALLDVGGEAHDNPTVTAGAEPVTGNRRERMTRHDAQVEWLRANDLDVDKVTARTAVVTEDSLTVTVFDVDAAGRRQLAVGPSGTFDDAVGFMLSELTVPLQSWPEAYGL